MTPYNLAAAVNRAHDSDATTLLDPGSGGTVIVHNKGLAVLKIVSVTGARTLASALSSDVGDEVLVVSYAASASVNGVAIEDGGFVLFRVTLNASGVNQWTNIASSAALGEIARGSTFPTVSATADTATITAAQVLGGVLNAVPTAAAAYTLPTAALLVAAISAAAVGDVIRFIITNNSAGANTITVGAGSGGTADGTLTVAQNIIRSFLIRLDNVTSGAEAYTVYGIG